MDGNSFLAFCLCTSYIIGVCKLIWNLSTHTTFMSSWPHKPTTPSSLKLFLLVSVRRPHCSGFSPTYCGHSLASLFSQPLKYWHSLTWAPKPFIHLNCLQVLLTSPVALKCKYYLSLETFISLALTSALASIACPAADLTAPLGFSVVVSNSAYLKQFF